MASIMNTVAKETITPSKVMDLRWIDVDVDSIVVPIRSEKEAREILSVIRGY